MAPFSEDGSARRARARASWSIVRRSLQEEAQEDLSLTTSPAERLAMMWPLAVAAFSLAGQRIARLPRASLPGRLIRGRKP